MADGPWHEGQQAWRRLAGRYQDAQPAPGPLDQGELALTALSDVGVVRRLLDQAEFDSVRTARRQGRSWSEIAIRLGVTRQSAWERWRDLDDAPPSMPASEADAVERARRVLSGPNEDMVSVRVARERRRRASVEVPNVIGLAWGAARAKLLGLGLVPAGSDPDGPPLGAGNWPDGVVTDQSPESGATVEPGSRITLWVDRGGGSGVREPRRPKPDPKTGRKMWDEVTDEAVG
ncbi:MAG TPA: PASTA domain-containing protein [Pseudonocardiaceae bacterium]|jgi:hypothetical protein|nr:PASTA domain-containing protein [Pseudonocardiaceae bacterium]